MLQGIVGLTLTISEVTAKTKASQNRTPADQRGVLEGLRDDPTTAEAAALIAQRLKD
jgi:transcriptional regulator